MIAAMMTAANLGARVTGWGFVVFTIGSIAWSTVGMTTGQTNLLATNAFLTLVNVIGVWRWLGRQRVYEDGGRTAARVSQRPAFHTLFTATGIAGMPVLARGGREIGKSVEALVTCETGRISYVVVSTGGVGGIAETLHAVPRDDLDFCGDALTLRHDEAWFRALPPLEGTEWPAEPARLQPGDAR